MPTTLDALDNPRIALLRLSALGDISHTVPVVRALRQARPDLVIDWIIDPAGGRLLGEIAGLNLIRFDKHHGAAELLRLRRRLHGEPYPVLLLMQTSLRANLIGRMVPARLRLGWDRRRARECHRLVINQRIDEAPPQHQVQGFLAFARSLGADAREPEWNLPIPAAARQFAGQRMPAAGQTLIISPCSSHPLREWSIEGYARVAEAAREDFGLEVMLCGGRSRREAEIGWRIQATARTPVTNMIGRDTLPGLLALLERAAAVLSPDAGPAHLANAVGTAVIGLHAATWSRRSGPYHSLPLCVDHFRTAARRYLHREAESLPWGTRIERPGVMDSISVAEVLDRLQAAHDDGYRPPGQIRLDQSSSL